MDPKKRRLQILVESFPEARTIEKNALDMKCEIKTKGFAYWLEDEVYIGRPVIIVKMPLQQRDMLIAENPIQVGVPEVKIFKHWLEIKLSPEPKNWDEIDQWVIAAYKSTAPKSLVRSI